MSRPAMAPVGMLHRLHRTSARWRTEPFSRFGNHDVLDVAPGDERFLMMRIYGFTPSAASTILVQGFFEEVKRLVPK